MSFSSKVKSEIAALETKDFKNIYSQTYGMLVFGAKFKGEFIMLSYENKNIVKKICSFLDILSQSENYQKSYRITKKGFYNIEIDLNGNSGINLETLKKPSLLNISKDCIVEFLTGAFLSCGSVMAPETDYHLEFNLTSMRLCKLLLDAINQLENVKLNPKISERKTGFSIYLKGSEKIEDFLVLMGAKNCAMEIMQIKMIKEVRNNINRNINFETANLSKITMSSSSHIKAIKKIIDYNAFSKLSPSLKETATLRINHPYISLNEISLLHKKKVSKSGVNHRLKKLIQIAQSL